MSQMSPNRRNVSSKETRELLTDTRWTEDEALSRLFHGNVYMHPDGRVLTIFSDKRGVLYPTQADFGIQVQLFEDAKTQKPSHYLIGRIPGAQDFPKYVPELVTDLATLLKTANEDLDSSIESLSKVEKKVKRLGRAKCIEPPIFPALVAYIGEVMRQAVNGKWQMRLSVQYGEVWEPWIVDPEGRLCNPFGDLFVMLAEPSEAISIMSATVIAIRFRSVPLRSSTLSENSKAAVRGVIFKRSQDKE